MESIEPVGHPCWLCFLVDNVVDNVVYIVHETVHEKRFLYT